MEISQNIKIQLPYNPPILLQSIYPKKMAILIRKDSCTPLFKPALLTIAKMWKQPVFIHGWMDKKDVVYVYMFCAWSLHGVGFFATPPGVCSPPGSFVHGDFPGKNTGVGCHSLLQGIFPTQGSSPGLPHCRLILYHLSHQGNPCVYVYIKNGILLLLFSHSVRSDSLWPHGLQHARLPCPSPSPGACSDSCFAIKNKEWNLAICNNMDEPWGHYASKISQNRKTNTIRKVGVKGVKKVQISSYKKTPGDVRYSMVTIINNTVLHIWRLSGE